MSPNELKPAAVFCGTIADQFPAATENGDLHIILSVEVTGKLRDPSDHAAGVDECPCVEREVRLTITRDESGDMRTRIAVENLERLGVSVSEVSRLHPDHPNAINLIGKLVCVRPRERDGVVFWNLAWPRQRLKSVTLDGLSERVDELAARIEKFRPGQVSPGRGEGADYGS
jgi:hypothetical protein